jgi:hypothetical protein
MGRGRRWTVVVVTLLAGIAAPALFVAALGTFAAGSGCDSSRLQGAGGSGSGSAGRGGYGGTVGQGGDNSPGGRGAGGRGGAAGTAAQCGGSTVVSNRNFDVLFLIDDSSSMRLSQLKLEQAFPAFITSLRSGAQGLPNLHIAVISSDMGAGDGSIANCTLTGTTGGGKQGIFQYSARGNCTATGLQADATYISDVAGVRNYTGNLESVFTCIAALGESGCGFEHQFAAILRALGADGRGPAPVENQGFLRPDAYLVIVMVTNEDDCSATPGVPLFDANSNTNIASQLGPPLNFRCNEFGHICDGTHPSRLAPGANISAMVNYANCTSNDAEGYLLGVDDTAYQLKSLKCDPSKVIVAAITGPATPYTVTWKAPSSSDQSCGAASCPWPVIAHTCTATDGSFADPSVRVSQLVGQFGANGLQLPICGDVANGLQRVAEKINALANP